MDRLFSDHRLLNRMRAIAAYTLDGRDKTAFCLGNRDQAAAQCFTIDMHHASAAIAIAAAIFCAGKIGRIAQRP